jgi:diacylglycerol kinase (ATP)
MDEHTPRILIVANPNSGGGKAGRLLPLTQAALEARGYAVQVFKSSGPNQIQAVVEELDEELEALVILGGDGTVREVVQAAPGPGLALAVLPTGSANVLAKDLRLPKKPAQLAEMVAVGKTQVVDSARARVLEPEGQPWQTLLLMAGAGLDGRIVQTIHENRAGGTLGKSRYIRPTLSVVFRQKYRGQWLVFDDGRREGPFAQLIVTNVGTYGGIWKLPGGVRMDDGSLDCIGLRAKGPLGWFRHAILGTLNLLRVDKKVFHEQVRHVRVESDGHEPCPFQLDGDPGGQTPFEIEVLPATIRLLVP